MYLMNLKSLRMLIYLSGLISVFLIIYTIYISNYNKNILKQNERKINFLMMQQQRGKLKLNSEVFNANVLLIRLNENCFQCQITSMEMVEIHRWNNNKKKF